MNMMNSLATQVLEFEQLSVHQLYKILKLRSAIFVVEQDCIYQDMDDLDSKSLHVMGYSAGAFAAYSRIILPDENNKVHIGRVLVDQKYRGRQLGRELMLKSIEVCNRKFPASPIELAAQCYLQAFYESLGFTAINKEYLMDGIPHVDMEREG